MGNIYFTSDTHFGHENIIKYCKRPFGSFEEMDSEIIRKWNLVVGAEDVVYHLGDVCFGKIAREKSYVNNILDSLNGRIVLIRGNHDSELVQKSGRFESVHDLLSIAFNDTEKFGATQVVLSHYPMGAWDHSHSGSVNLHGHCHGTWPANDQQMDVGSDVWDFSPVPFERIVERLRMSPPYARRMELCNGPSYKHIGKYVVQTARKKEKEQEP